MMWIKRFDNGSSVVLPEEPDGEKTGVVFAYLKPGDKLPDAYAGGDARVVGPLILAHLEGFSRHCPESLRKRFFRDLLGIVAGMAKALEGGHVIEINGEEDDDESDEDD